MVTNQIVSIVGARPQFVKLAPIVQAFSEYGEYYHSVLHTGQHYDDNMSRNFFDLLGISTPDKNLTIGSASHGAQTAAMLNAIESHLTEQKPDGVLVYGDTNSTLAGVLAASKLNIPVAHIESGLRSFNRSMPEEINRVATDHCSDRLYAPTPLAMNHLEKENLADRAMLSGDVMRDAVEQFYAIASRKSKLLSRLNLKSGQFALLTLHRPTNTHKTVFRQLLATINEFASTTIPVLFPVHPRTRTMVNECSDLHRAFKIHSPLNYLDMLVGVAHARVVITDSGGLQKEAAFLNTPCITIRNETEWAELVGLGVNQLVNTERNEIKNALNTSLKQSDPFDDSVQSELDRHYGRGNAARKIVADFLSWLN